MNDETRFIIVHESWLASWIKDAGSIGSLAGLIYVNHQYGAGNGAVDTAGAFLLLGFLFLKGKLIAADSCRAFTKDELKRWALTEEAGQ